MSRLPPVRWAISDGLVPYRAAEAFMQAEAGAIADGRAAELVWLLEHPPLYTAGTSAKDADLVAPDRFPVYKTGRGGQYTYHGPGQRVAYVLLNLKARNPDVRAFVDDLETWILRTLASFNVRAASRPDRVGLWVPRKGFPEGGPEDKIAAIGVRLHRWVSFHGIALNVDPDLEHFSGIVPCGIRDHGVTSLYALGQPVLMSEVDSALRVAFESVFGATAPAAPPDLSAAARVPAEA